MGTNQVFLTARPSGVWQEETTDVVCMGLAEKYVWPLLNPVSPLTLDTMVSHLAWESEKKERTGGQEAGIK